MKLNIKHMVGVRCQPAVQAKLDKLGLHYGRVDLGEIEFKQNISPQQHAQLQRGLHLLGAEIFEQHECKVIAQLQAIILELVLQADTLPRMKNSAYISQRMERDYAPLAALFSAATGITIEHSIIVHKMERVKELLLYDELTLTEIAYKLSYSSVAHLSTQFKKITGMTPTTFKQLRHKMRHL